jgi:hypothetical protein
MHPEALRPLFDARGLLVPGALAPPALDLAYAVFAQRQSAEFDVDAWSRHSAQFFGASLGLTCEKRPDAPRAVDAAGLVLAREGHDPAVRIVFARPASADDHAAADRAGAAQPGAGLDALARRCGYVYLVVCEPDAGAAAASDRDALALAGVLASVLLGPVLPPDGASLFGVRGARERLATRAR